VPSIFKNIVISYLLSVFIIHGLVPHLHLQEQSGSAVESQDKFSDTFLGELTVFLNPELGHEDNIQPSDNQSFVFITPKNNLVQIPFLPVLSSFMFESTNSFHNYNDSGHRSFQFLRPPPIA
jgi:hypothetical protein